MGFTIKDEPEKYYESKTERKNNNDMSLTSDSKGFYHFLQKLNLRTEMGME